MCIRYEGADAVYSELSSRGVRLWRNGEHPHRMDILGELQDRGARLRKRTWYVKGAGNLILEHGAVKQRA